MVCIVSGREQSLDPTMGGLDVRNPGVTRSLYPKPVSLEQVTGVEPDPQDDEKGSGAAYLCHSISHRAVI